MFHGFFYTDDREAPATILALPMSDKQRRVFTAVLDQYPPVAIDGETYWRSCYRFLMYDAPQGYIAWEGRSYWLVALPRVDGDGRFDRSTSGLHVIEFTPERIHHAWVSAREFNDPATEEHGAGTLPIEDSGMMRAIEAMRVFGNADDDGADDDDDDAIEITLPDALSELVVTPWYWSRQCAPVANQRPLAADELDVLQANVGWTDRLHSDMAKRFPL